MINFDIESLYLFFESESFNNIVSILQPVCILAILLFIGAIIWALWKSTWLYWYVSWDFADFIHGGPVTAENAIQK